MSKIEKSWYQGPWFRHWRNWLMLPLCGLFWLLSSVRRKLFTLGVLKAYSAKVPVIVVGNISVGGNGKTPFVVWLVELLHKHNIRVAVISRGYGGHSEHYPVVVDETYNTTVFGDEPVLIAKRCDCPVVVGPDRVKSCEYIDEHFDVDVIICDDGMQHYKLNRDIEIAIVDAQRQFGNGWLMPIGPLREKVSRLDNVDYVVYNGNIDNHQYPPKASFDLGFDYAINLTTDRPFEYTILSAKVHGVCAIGNGARFEQTLIQYLHPFELSLESFSALTDHHRFEPRDFEEFGNDYVLMTEKDAVKCTEFAKPHWHYLPVNARLPQAFTDELLAHIQRL